MMEAEMKKGREGKAQTNTPSSIQKINKLINKYIISKTRTLHNCYFSWDYIKYKLNSIILVFTIPKTISENRIKQQNNCNTQ